MNTKTMRLPPRRFLTPDKRKERDGVPPAGEPPEIVVPKPAPIIPPFQSGVRKASAAAAAAATAAVTTSAEPVGSNQLLAGYLAHEFLTSGTLFGDLWDPARAQAQAQAVPMSAHSAEPRNHKVSRRGEPTEPSDPKRRRYVEVANLFRADGTRFPGIVNPAQLDRFLKL